MPHQSIAILGSTGSIGTSTLEVVDHLSEDISVFSLAAHSNIDLLEQQALKYRPQLLGVYDKEKALELQKRLPQIPVLAGLEGLIDLASADGVDLVVSAISGTLGIQPTYAAIQKGIPIALANKEALVSTGELLTKTAKEKGVPIIPVDSEHSAIFQCLRGENPKEIRRIILTASGGPFRDFSKEQLSQVSLKDALQHPNWSMGPKITVDSSTLMNKGLEVIEAHWLFDIALDQIDVVIHPQSIIHSMVEFVDNSLIAQMGEPSMKTPIQYALTYPERRPGSLQQFDFLQHGSLSFNIPDTQRFPCLRLAYEAAKQGASLPCYMNAANEVLVQSFMKRQISWADIGAKLESLMERHQVVDVPSLDMIIEVDTQARLEAAQV